ncbi:hypothetical protein [Kitasatospora sp. NPDC001683]
MNDPHNQGDPGSTAIAAVTDRAAQRAKELGVTEALEALRAELEREPRLGRHIRTVAEGTQQVEFYSTRIEGDPATDRPAVNVVHAFAPAPPWPPTVRIASVVPEDPLHPGA